MKKIINFIKTNQWVWILVVVMIAIIGDVYLQRVLTTKVSPTPTPVPKIASYKSVTPGVSTEADLKKILGTPAKTTVNGNQTIDDFKSTSELRFHSAIIENGKVIFIKEIISAHDTNTVSSLTDVYGFAPTTLYSKYPNASFNLYVYPSNGIAYLGHKDGTLLEIWYFIPMSLENFLSTWATDYSSKPSVEIVQ